MIMFKKKSLFILLMVISMMAMFASVASAAEVKPVSAVGSSMQDANYDAPFAIDGDETTRWASAADGNMPSITFDLGAVKTLTGAKIIWEAAYAKGYTLEVSNDNATWTQVYTTNESTGETEELAFSGKGQYVKLSVTEPGPYVTASIFEATFLAAAANPATGDNGITVYVIGGAIALALMASVVFMNKRAKQ